MPVDRVDEISALFEFRQQEWQPSPGDQPVWGVPRQRTALLGPVQREYYRPTISFGLRSQLSGEQIENSATRLAA
jgi:hypothetical protein